MPELNQTTVLRELVLPRVNVDGSVSSSQEGVSLINDSDSPGANKVYGTNSSGVRGWKPDPADSLSQSFPEDFGAIGDGVTDDSEALQEWADYIVANEVVGRTLPGKTYATSTNITFTVTSTGVRIESPGTIKGITGSAISELVTVLVHTGTYVDIKVDANDITDCTGVRLTNTSGSSRPVFHCHVKNATIGVLLQDNIEGAELNIYADSCERACKVTAGTDVTPETPDDVKINIIGRSCDNYFTATDADGISGTCTIHSEQGGTGSLAVIEQDAGSWTYSGHIRGGKRVVDISGVGTSLAAFNGLVIHTIDATGLKVQVDSTTCVIKGDIHIINSTNIVADGVWIKDCADGSSLLLTMKESYNGYGIKLGDNANSKQVAYFTLLPGSRIGSISSNQAVVLDYSHRSLIESPYFIGGGVVISDIAKSRFNVVRVFNHNTPVSISGTGTNDNMIVFRRPMSTTDRDAITNPTLGYRCESVISGTVIKTMNYNTNTAAWE